MVGLKVKMTMEIPAWKQDFLDADLRYFQAETKFNLCETMEKLRGNHSLRWKVMRVLSKHNPQATSNLTIDAFLYGLEAIKEYQIFSYEIAIKDNDATVIIDINEYYFELVKMFPMPMISKLLSKKTLFKHLEKQIKKTYNKRATVEVIEGKV